MIHSHTWICFTCLWKPLYSKTFNLKRTVKKGNPKTKMMQQFIFKTVPAGHKARLQSVEHKKAKKGGGGGTWCTQKEPAPHHR